MIKSNLSTLLCYTNSSKCIYAVTLAAGGQLSVSCPLSEYICADLLPRFCNHLTKTKRGFELWFGSW